MFTQELLPGKLLSVIIFPFLCFTFSKKYDGVLWNFVYSVSTRL